MAEAVFRNILKTKNLSDEWLVDSAAVCDYHIGKSPDKRTLAVLKDHGTVMPLNFLKVIGEDFTAFDYIMGMDESNISELKSMCAMAVNGTARCTIQLLGTYDPLGKIIVDDPYYDDDAKAFEKMPPTDPRVMYLILRRDLLEKLKWPIGALVSQGAHAATACLWKFRDDPEVLSYMSNLEHMRKVTLEVSDEQELMNCAAMLQENNIDNSVWIEDGMPVCVAVKPLKKSIISKHLKSFSLFS
ncbi:unnamed protein product [Enterobius vermicularis]|uniref:LMWPc domain-containing protein n=1 Tax=Enterobius vermicularis TaxID=51028 RepID=A0A158QAY9_ENTVE|nr:unnamed protein product [Enterobius vermicularis]